MLKNTYSKKNRPNNSKSVAIGSRSQGGSIRLRSVTADELGDKNAESKPQVHAQAIDQVKRQDIIAEGAFDDEDEDDVFIEEVEGSDYTSSQEEVQYLKRRSSARKDLRSANSDSRHSSRTANLKTA